MSTSITYSLGELQALPTLHQGHFDDLKVEADGERVWLSRLTIADGAPYDNQVTVERLVDGVWITIAQYQARSGWMVTPPAGS